MMKTPRTTFVVLLVALLSLALSTSAYAKKTKPAKYGRVQVTTPTGSYPVLFDGNPAGVTAPTPDDPTPHATLEVEPGRHRLEVLMPDGTRWTRDLQVSAGRLYCVGVTYKNIVRHCWDYPITARITQTSQGGEVISFASNVVYNGPSPLNYTWTVSPSTVKIVSGGAGSPDLTINTAGVTAPVTVRLVVDDDDGSGDPRCRAEATAEYAVSCSSVSSVNISHSQNYYRSGDKITFTAHPEYAGPGRLNYRWNVSPAPARILNGDGTEAIVVDTTGVDNSNTISVSVTVGDGSNDPGCPPATANDSLTCGYDCGMSSNLNDLKARLDNFASELQRTPGAEGYIYIYGPRRKAMTVSNQARDYIVNSRGLEDSRIHVKPVGMGDKVHFEFYVVNAGETPPQPQYTPLQQPSGVQHIPTAPRHRRGRR